MQLRKHLSILLLIVPSLAGVSAPIKIDAPIVKATAGAIPLTKPEALLRRIEERLAFNYGKGDHIISLKDIAAHEDMFDSASHEKLMTGSIGNLVMILTQEPTLKDSYIKDFRLIQQYLEELITMWSQQRNCEATLLKVLVVIANNPGQEQELLSRHLTCMNDYYKFLLDAEQFLTDFLYTYRK